MGSWQWLYCFYLNFAFQIWWQSPSIIDSTLCSSCLDLNWNCCVFNFHCFFDYNTSKRKWKRSSRHNWKKGDFVLYFSEKSKGVPPKEFCKKRCSNISQNLQENTCARISFLIKLQAYPTTLLKKRLWHRCLSVRFTKFLRKTLGNSFWKKIFVFSQAFSKLLQRNHYTFLK